jgi:hypothetical protein
MQSSPRAALLDRGCGGAATLRRLLFDTSCFALRTRNVGVTSAFFWTMFSEGTAGMEEVNSHSNVMTDDFVTRSVVLHT